MSTLITRREFEHKGVEVEERIYWWITDTPVRKLIWAKSPMDEAYSKESGPSPMFHKDFWPDTLASGGDKVTEEIARDKVREAFEQYYKLGDYQANENVKE